MNKTVVTCFSIGIVGVIIVTYILFCYLTALHVKRVPTDKFTTCIRIVMAEPRYNGKEISAKETSDICMNMFNQDK